MHLQALSDGKSTSEPMALGCRKAANADCLQKPALACVWLSGVEIIVKEARELWNTDSAKGTKIN